MILETSKRTAIALQDALAELCPQYTATILDDDPMLFELGFAREVPCRVALDVTKEQLAEIIDMATDTEYFAYCEGDPSKDDPFYQKYLRCGWVSDFLLQAKFLPDDGTEQE